MKPSAWALPAVFLAVSIPVLMALHALDAGGEYRIWIAIVAGALATALMQKRLAQRKDPE